MRKTILIPASILLMNHSAASTDDLFDDIDYEIKLDYIEIPVELQSKLLLTNLATIGLLADPYFAIELDANRHSRIDGISERRLQANQHRQKTNNHMAECDLTAYHERRFP